MIILAGGFGTRLQDTIPGLPKCLAPVAGRPFLLYVIRHLLANGVTKFIFSLGYKHALVESFLENEFPTLDYTCVIEEQPLGTGGAIKLCLQQAHSENVWVANGDTIFKVQLREMYEQHEKNQAACTTLALKPMKRFDRYGVVQTNNDGWVTAFQEKKFYEEGNINGGLYLIRRQNFLAHDFPEIFSFEKDYLESFFSKDKIQGLVQDAYFIDIGIPSDFARAQEELKTSPFSLKNINDDWSLFLDRDGVINYEKENDYIYHWDEFRFYPGVTEAVSLLSKKFKKIIIVSNQRGVGKGLMTEEALQTMHERMVAAFENAGGRIDGIYYCTSVDPKAGCRKPNPGMAIQAAEEQPLDLSRTIMVGNKISDMKFGRNAGTATVYLTTTHPEQELPHPDIDLVFDSLVSFARSL